MTAKNVWYNLEKTKEGNIMTKGISSVYFKKTIVKKFLIYPPAEEVPLLCNEICNMCSTI